MKENERRKVVVTFVDEFKISNPQLCDVMLSNLLLAGFIVKARPGFSLGMCDELIQQGKILTVYRRVEA